jgi:hypothetical protein
VYVSDGFQAKHPQVAKMVCDVAALRLLDDMDVVSQHKPVVTMRGGKTFLKTSKRFAVTHVKARGHALFCRAPWGVLLSFPPALENLVIAP